MPINSLLYIILHGICAMKFLMFYLFEVLKRSSMSEVLEGEIKNRTSDRKPRYIHTATVI